MRHCHVSQGGLKLEVAMVTITSQKYTEHSIENRAAVACSRALLGVCSYSFFYCPKRISIKIHREVCLVCGNCMAI